MTNFVFPPTATLRAAGARVSLRVFEDAGHLLRFSHEKEELAQLENWLAPLLDAPARDAATETPPSS